MKLCRDGQAPADPIGGQDFPSFWTMLRHVAMDHAAGHTRDQIELRVVWKICQWSSDNGTDKELFDMYRQQGSPGEISIVANAPKETDDGSQGR